MKNIGPTGRTTIYGNGFKLKKLLFGSDQKIRLIIYKNVFRQPQKIGSETRRKYKLEDISSKHSCHDMEMEEHEPAKRAKLQVHVIYETWRLYTDTHKRTSMIGH